MRALCGAHNFLQLGSLRGPRARAEPTGLAMRVPDRLAVRQRVERMNDDLMSGRGMEKRKMSGNLMFTREVG